MRACVAELLRGAEHRLHHELGRDLAREPEQDPRLDHRLRQQREVGGAGAGDGRDGVHLTLRDPDDPAEVREDLRRGREVRLRGVRAARDAGDPSCTVDGVFGIARTTGTRASRWPSMSAVGIAAAIESTVCSSPRSPPISPSRASMSCGFTATTTIAAPETASAFEVVARTSYRSISSSTRSWRRDVATSSDGSRQPELTRPLMSASPILPAPRTAMRRASTATAGV